MAQSRHWFVRCYSVGVNVCTSVLNFFVTNTGDPHDLFASYYVPVAQLLTQDKLTAPYQGELKSCNVYTRRIYDDYLMVEV